jgi:ribose 5-phosphate isomerase A
VASAADMMIVIADRSKKVAKLGAFPLPVEVDRFGLPFTAEKVVSSLQRSGCHGFGVTLRTMRNGQVPFVTDGGNYILDCQCKLIPDPELTAFVLSGLPGVVEHGLFLGLAHKVILAGADGVETLNRA